MRLSRFFGIALVGVTLAGASGCALAPGEEVDSASDAVVAGPYTAITSYAGETRWIWRQNGSTKLYINADAKSQEKPWLGFHDSNSFDNSCAPDAGFNLLHWWGIDAVAPQGTVTASTLGSAMKTNHWGVGFSGTSTPNFKAGMNSFLDRYCNGVCQAQHHDLRDMSNPGAPLILWQRIQWQLDAGSPVVIPYKTGGTRGHFATIVGLEKVSAGAEPTASDRVILANIIGGDAGDHRMRWDTFVSRWKRDYVGPDAIFDAAGEEPYEAISIGPPAVSAPPGPSMPTGSGPGTHVKLN